MATKKKAASKKPEPKKLSNAAFQKKCTDDINSAIAKFIKAPVTAFHKSFGTLIPIVTTCFNRLDKVKFNNTPVNIRGIKKLHWKESLSNDLKVAVEKGDVNYLHRGVFRFINWYTDKNK